jgi:uncharacterized protein
MPAGAALVGTFVASVTGVLFYQARAPFYPTLIVAPDYALGILFGIGSRAGIEEEGDKEGEQNRNIM